jgi:hypothetical protein
MAQDKADVIEFDILIRSEGSGETPDVNNLDRFRPDHEDIENCRLWLDSRGVVCHKTEFGLACSTSLPNFESLFSTQATRSSQNSGKPGWHLSDDPVPPREIAEYIEDITIWASPELF